MRNEFCTLFDVNYLPRGLVLYSSLREVCGDFRLRVFCMDEATESLLDRMRLPGLVVVGLEELEAHDRELASVKRDRTQVEYCWTATPAVCLYALEREPELEMVTYLDADLMFFADPAPLFDELADDAALIVPHRHASDWDGWDGTVGNYNVQFVTFRRDERGLAPLRWWRERCLEWCYDRIEDGRWGDQRYLDDWPERFAGVHVLAHPGGGLAPWNAKRYTLERRDGSLLVDGYPVVFYHYQSLELVRGLAAFLPPVVLPSSYRLNRGPSGLVWRTDWPFAERERELLWDPYLRRLAEALERLWALDPAFDAGFVRLPARSLARDVAYEAARRLLPRTLRAALRRLRRASRSPVASSP